MFVYQSVPTAARLRGRILESVEHEEDIRVLQQVCVFIEQLKKEEKHPLQEIVVSPRIRALSNVPPTNVDGDYKDDIVDMIEHKYV